MTKIILVGGAAGTGKTTVAKELCQKFEINHRLATGFIRETIRTITNEKALSSHTFSVTDDPAFEHILKQTKLMKDSINSCINRCYEEGTSLVIEGNHLIPGIIENKNITLFILLYVKDENNHREMIGGQTHKKRKITDDEFKRNREIQEELIARAKKQHVPVIESSKNVLEIVSEIEQYM